MPLQVAYVARPWIVLTCRSHHYKQSNMALVMAGLEGIHVYRNRHRHKGISVLELSVSASG